MCWRWTLAQPRHCATSFRLPAAIKRLARRGAPTCAFFGRCRNRAPELPLFSSKTQCQYLRMLASGTHLIKERRIYRGQRDRHHRTTWPHMLNFMARTAELSPCPHEPQIRLYVGGAAVSATSSGPSFQFLTVPRHKINVVRHYLWRPVAHAQGENRIGRMANFAPVPTNANQV